jgi:hypothetical protein
MADNLDQVKEELYKIFNEAVKKHPDYKGCDYMISIENRKAMSHIAQAIVAIEREQREATGVKIVKLENK